MFTLKCILPCVRIRQVGARLSYPHQVTPTVLFIVNSDQIHMLAANYLHELSLSRCPARWRVPSVPYLVPQCRQIEVALLEHAPHAGSRRPAATSQEHQARPVYVVNGSVRNARLCRLKSRKGNQCLQRLAQMPGEIRLKRNLSTM